MSPAGDNWAIRVEGLSKKFGLTLRQTMHYGLRDVARRLAGRSNRDGVLRPGEFWAVKNVDFDLHPGEALGVMGVNGSGKTTLLRILNGAYPPDRGRAQLRGRVGALIAAGAGFAPMLTGRENVYVNGALLGLSTAEIADLMDEIVAFSELGEFIDLPVRNYSSGMYVRLGFAIAALSRPDVLLMDEVLAVGDMNFQKKCFDHILRLKRQGTAIVLVSHSVGAIWAVCDRGLFMDHGEVKVAGPVEDTIRAYDDQNARNAVVAGRQFEQAAAAHRARTGAASEALPAEYGHPMSGTGDAICTAFRVTKLPSATEIEEVGFAEGFAVEVDVTVLRPIEAFLLRVVVDAMHYRNILTLDSYEQGVDLGTVTPGFYRFRVEVPQQNLRPGAYRFNVSLLSRYAGLHLFLWLNCGRLVIKAPQDRLLYSDPTAVLHLEARIVTQREEES